jgi:glycosyl transferase family 25
MEISYYVVHYTKNKDRRERLNKEFKKYQINNVIWMDDYDRENIGDNINLYKYNPIYNNIPINKGEISLTLKHYYALKDIVENNKEYAVIMEDNVTFTDNIKNLVSEYLEEAKNLNWDIIFEGDTYYLRYEEGKVKKEQKLYKKSNKITKQCQGSSRCSNFYIINLEAAKKLYEYFVPFHNVCDHWSNHLFRKLDFNIYWVEPPKVHRIMSHKRVAFSGND